MFSNWVCIVNGEVVWEKYISSTEAFASTFDYIRMYKDSDVFLDVRNHRILVGHFDLG